MYVYVYVYVKVNVYAHVHVHDNVQFRVCVRVHAHAYAHAHVDVVVVVDVDVDVAVAVAVAGDGDVDINVVVDVLMLMLLIMLYDFVIDCSHAFPRLFRCWFGTRVTCTITSLEAQLFRVTLFRRLPTPSFDCAYLTVWSPTLGHLPRSVRTRRGSGEKGMGSRERG